MKIHSKPIERVNALPTANKPPTCLTAVSTRSRIDIPQNPFLPLTGRSCASCHWQPLSQRGPEAPRTAAGDPRQLLQCAVGTRMAAHCPRHNRNERAQQPPAGGPLITRTSPTVDACSGAFGKPPHRLFDNKDRAIERDGVGTRVFTEVTLQPSPTLSHSEPVCSISHLHKEFYASISILSLQSLITTSDPCPEKVIWWKERCLSA